ncbi:hypothetical protein CVT26_004457 [Gymnopilus dilepis]|uniref:Uncharacterized protein n=1 Tax=Gymnopilus dilepis TaxID=231916 RepID=A0A409W7C5_9AGAR|nr:hypothetical protein CVT26_004457 [Gymnopilus dilepis]
MRLDLPDRYLRPSVERYQQTRGRLWDGAPSLNGSGKGEVGGVRVRLCALELDLERVRASITNGSRSGGRSGGLRRGQSFTITSTFRPPSSTGWPTRLLLSRSAGNSQLVPTQQTRYPPPRKIWSTRRVRCPEWRPPLKGHRLTRAESADVAGREEKPGAGAVKGDVLGELHSGVRKVGDRIRKLFLSLLA